VWRKLYRWALGFIAVGFGAILSLTLILFLVVDTKKFTTFLVATVREQTGAQLAIGRLSFNPFRGFRAKNITLTPRSQQTPLLSLQDVNVTYNLWALLYGTIRIDQANISGGQIEITKKDQHWNFEELLNQEPQVTGNLTSSNAKTKQNQNEMPKPIGVLITELTKDLFIPVRIAISDVGFERLSVSAKEIDQNGLHHHYHVKDAALKIGITALAHSLSLTTAVSAAAIQYNDQTYDKITFDLSTQIASDPKTRTFQISQLTFKAFDVLTTRLSAAISANDSIPTALDYRIDFDNQLNLKLPDSIRRRIGPAFTASGNMQLILNEAKGTFDLNDVTGPDLQSTLKKILPEMMSLTIKTKDINIQSPEQGLTIRSANLNMQVKESKSADKNINLAIAGDQRISDINLMTQIDGEKNNYQLSDLNIGIKSDIAITRHRKSSASILAQVPNIIIQRKQYEPIRLPFKISIEGSDQPTDHQTANQTDYETRVKLNADIGEYAATDINLECQKNCEKFSVEAHQRTPSFAKIWEILRPTLIQIIPPKFQPELVAGEQNFNLSLLGSIPKKDTERIDLSNLTAEMRASFGMQGINVKLPGNQVSINDGSVDIKVDGHQNSIKLVVNSNIPKASALLSNRQKNGNMTEIDRFNLNQVFYAKSRTRTWPKSLRDVNITGDTIIELGTLSIANLLKTPIKQTKISAKTKILAAKTARIERLAVSLPDFGASLSAAASVKLDEKLIPLDAKAHLEASVGDIPSDYLVGYSATGRVSSNFDLTTSDMKEILIQGALTLDHLTLKSTHFTSTVKSQGPSPDHLEKTTDPLAIEDAHGTIPISMILDLQRSTDENHSDHLEDFNSGSDNLVASDQQIQNLADQYLQKNQTQSSADTTIAVNADYSSFRPFFPSRTPITINRLQIKKLTMENTELDMTVAQNMIALNNFSTKFLGGKIQGEAIIGYKNKLSQVKAAVHLTRLDTEKLVKTIPGLRKKARGIFGTSDPYVDAAAHIQYDLTTNDMAGGLNITSIGKDQLRMIMYYLDPTDSDTSISAIKAALNVGEIKLVAIPIKNGEIGVDVDVRLLSAPIPTPKIQGFPIAKLVSNFQSQGGQEANDTLDTQDADDTADKNKFEDGQGDKKEVGDHDAH
jgi:hypothetical protein